MENKLLEANIKYYDEREKTREVIAELNRTTEDLRDALKLEQYYKDQLERYENLDSGMMVDEIGQLWVLVEEYYYANEELEEYEDVKDRVMTLRHLYDEREQGMFYTMLTRCDIRNLVRKENDYIPN